MMKVNVILRLEFELAYHDIALQYISHYAIQTYPTLEIWAKQPIHSKDLEV